MARTGKPAVRHVAAVQSAIAVLNVLADEGVELGTNEIARRTSLGASTVSRLLATLADDGLVQFIASSGRYRLGMGVLRLASRARESLDLRGLARPVLEELTDATGETATLSLPGEHEVLTVDFVPSEASVRSVASIGRNSVAHATAVGKVFLAWGGRLPPGELARYTAHTIVDRDGLAAEIQRVRAAGWARAAREREDDLGGVAVPVLDSGGALVAILGVQGPSSRFDEAAMEAAVPMLAERAAMLGSVL